MLNHVQEEEPLTVDRDGGQQRQCDGSDTGKERRCARRRNRRTSGNTAEPAPTDPIEADHGGKADEQDRFFRPGEPKRAVGLTMIRRELGYVLQLGVRSEGPEPHPASASPGCPLGSGWLQVSTWIVASPNEGTCSASACCTRSTIACASATESRRSTVTCRPACTLWPSQRARAWCTSCTPSTWCGACSTAARISGSMPSSSRCQ